MNLDEIPTPETDAAYNQWLFETDKSHKIRMGQTMESLERRLTIEKNRADDMSKLAHSITCEAMEYRRLLTIARKALKGVSKNDQPSGPFWHGGEIQTKVREALKLTTPKPCV